MQCCLKMLVSSALKWPCIFSSLQAHHPLSKCKHVLALLVYVTCLASEKHWHLLSLEIKQYIYASSLLSAAPLLLISMIDSKDYFLRLSISTFENRNVLIYSPLGVRPLFRNIKVTINILVFFSYKKHKWGTFQNTPYHKHKYTKTHEKLILSS